MSTKFRLVFVLIFLAAIGYGLYQVWYINDQYAKEQQVREQMQPYKPADKTAAHRQTAAPPDSLGLEEAEEVQNFVVNQSILDAQQINGDIVGWLTLDGTRIDYPFVQAGDNDFYLRRDMNGKQASAGTLFLDYRVNAGFTDFVTVIYGHNMRNGSMFADLRRYGEAAFFEANEEGQLTLPYASYRLRVFAFLEVRGDDGFIYGFDEMDGLGRRQFLSYIKESAIFYRALPVSESDRLVILSTCVSDRKEMRRIVVARLEDF